jgi:hypothetical protein
VTVLSGIALVLGLMLLIVGVMAAYISASVNMSFNNPLPRAGCALLLGGAVLAGLGYWGLS